VAIKVKTQLHGVEVADLHGLIKQREYEVFAVWSELDSHHFIGGFNFFIELKFDLSSALALSEVPEPDGIVR
jgi:hypothetical protein